MKSIWKFLNDREEAISFLLSKPKNVVTPVTFQKIETEIQMLYDFYGLLKAGDKKFRRKKAFKPYKKLGNMVAEVSLLQQEESMLSLLFEKDKLPDFKRDIRRLKEAKREEYFVTVDEKFVHKLNSKKGELESWLRNINKKLVQGYLKKKAKKISKVMLKGEVNASKLDELRNRLNEYAGLQSLVQKVKTEKDGIAQALKNWKVQNNSLQFITGLKESGIFTAVELKLIKKVEVKLLAEESELVTKVSESILQKGSFLG